MVETPKRKGSIKRGASPASVVTRKPKGGQLKSQDLLRQQAYERIEELIVTQELSPGRKLTEKELSELIELGRTPVREALQRLGREGLVTIHPRSGIEISTMTIDRQFELLEVRNFMQDLLVKCAAERADPSQREEMLRLSTEILLAAEQDDGKRYFRLSRHIHTLLCDAAGNRFLRSMMTNLYGLSRQFGYIHYRRAGSLVSGAKLHAHILQAVADGDAKAARVASQEMMQYLAEFTRRSVMLTPVDD